MAVVVGFARYAARGLLAPLGGGVDCVRMRVSADWCRDISASNVDLRGAVRDMGAAV